MMALSDAAKQRKLVDQFLASGPPEAPGQGAGFLGQMNADITRQKAARAAQRTTNRAIGSGPFQGKSPFRNTPLIGGGQNAGAQIMQQGMGNVPPVGGGGGQLALGAGRPGGLPAIPGPSGVAVPPGQPALPAGPQTTALPAGAQPQAIGAGPRALGAGTPVAPAAPAGSGGVTGAATRAAATSADDLIGVAGKAAAGGADDVARAAAGRAGAAAAKAGAGGIRATATNMGVNFTKAGLYKGLGVAGAGYMVSAFFDGMNLGGENSLIDRGGTGAILGAGLGGGAAMALGLASGPVGWAALGGAALFGGYKALWGDDKTTPEKMTGTVEDTRGTITELGAMYGISPDAMDEIMLQYDASTRMYLDAGDMDGLKSFMAGMGTQLPALMLTAREQDKAAKQESQRYNDMIAAQAQFAPIFEQSMTNAQRNNQTAYQASNDAAAVFDQSNPNLAALYRQTAAQSQAAASNLHAAYAKQMATAPRQANDAAELERMMAQEQLLNQALAGAGQF